MAEKYSNQEKVNNIFTEVRESYVTRLYLNGPIEDQDSHMIAIETIRQASENDEIHVYLTSPGGVVDIAEMYIHAFSETRAKIITHGVGGVCSAATTILLHGHEIVIEPGSYYMFHNVQYGTDGDSAHIKQRSEFYYRLYKERFYDLYKAVMTEEELSTLFEHAGEVYLTSEEMLDRLQKHSVKLEEKYRTGPAGESGSTNLREIEITCNDAELAEAIKEYKLNEGDHSSYTLLPSDVEKPKAGDCSIDQAHTLFDEVVIELSSGTSVFFDQAEVTARDLEKFSSATIDDIASKVGIKRGKKAYNTYIEAIVNAIRNN